MRCFCSSATRFTIAARRYLLFSFLFLFFANNKSRKAYIPEVVFGSLLMGTGYVAMLLSQIFGLGFTGLLVRQHW